MTCKVTRLNKDESDKYRKIKLFIGGKYKNEIRNRNKLAFFHKSMYLHKSP